jgi:hypothetical protein
MLFFRVRKVAALAMWTTGLLVAAFAEGTVAELNPEAAGRPALLNDAFNALLEHQGRWAYTETQTGVQDGKPRAESSFRVDPSAPYAEQHVPLKIHGKPPTEKQLKEAADRGERAAKRRLEQMEKIPKSLVAEEKPKVHRADEVRLWVSGQRITPQLDQAKIVTEDDKSVTYEVPMHLEGKGEAHGFLDKFELTACINKVSRQFERATIRQRASLRVKLIAKVSDTVLEFEFSTPDPRYPSVPTKFTADGHVSLLFGKVHIMHSESVRSEFRHMTPYDALG